jgi:C4-dicarboxylate-specific signal transduction histidine kinase
MRSKLIYKFIFLTAGLVLFVIIINSAVYLVNQKQMILGRSRVESISLARTTATILANAMVQKDYPFIVDHCMLLIRSRDDLLHIIVHKKDGESLFISRNSWRAERLEDKDSKRMEKVEDLVFLHHFSSTVGAEVLEACLPVTVTKVHWGRIRLIFSAEPLKSAVRAMYRNMALTGAFFLFLSLVIAILLSRLFVRPIVQLTDAVNRISAGDLKQTVQVSTRDEIGELAAAFNKMVRDLQQTMADLRQAVSSEEAKAKQLEQAYEQLKETQAQLIQAGKLAALGELGAGIAHELNQPITSIRGFSQLLLREARSKMPGKVDTLERIIHDTERMGRIVDNVRTFARQQGYSPEELPATAPLDAALELVSEQLRQRGITLERQVEQDLPRVLGDKIQLEQVFLNLLSNARDALEQLEARDGEGNGKRIRLAVELEGGHVRYTIEDNGPGVAGEHEDRIFDPFFTTKPPGKGMGLGLSLTYGIVKEHKGEISYSRASGGGARFTMLIPIAGRS